MSFPEEGICILMKRNQNQVSFPLVAGILLHPGPPPRKFGLLLGEDLHELVGCLLPGMFLGFWFPTSSFVLAQSDASPLASVGLKSDPEFSF